MKSPVYAGEIVRAALMNDEVLASEVNSVFPMIADEATLPYISYQITGMQFGETKTPNLAPDRLSMALYIYADDYDRAAAISDRVITVLREVRRDDFRRITPVNFRNDMVGEAYVNIIEFNIRTNPL